MIWAVIQRILVQLIFCLLVLHTVPSGKETVNASRLVQFDYQMRDDSSGLHRLPLTSFQELQNYNSFLLLCMVFE